MKFPKWLVEAWVRDPNSGKKSIAKANFFSKNIAKRRRSERQIIFCEAKRSEFASLSQFFAILRKMRKFKRKFCSKKLREIFRVLQFCAFIVFLKKATHRITFMKKQDIQLVLVGFWRHRPRSEGQNWSVVSWSVGGQIFGRSVISFAHAIYWNLLYRILGQKNSFHTVF